ncbi:MAG: hypothetical protein Q7T87_10985 [Polaromonas sp.]|nr:hypothetical protein [Polaromonas sp.]
MTLSRIALLALAICLGAPALAQKAANYYTDDYDFTKTTWLARYTIYISPYYQGRVTVVKELNQERDKKDEAGFRRWEPLFPPTYPLAALPLAKPRLWNEDLGYMVIEYDRSGRVLTPNSSVDPLTGRTILDYRSQAIRLVSGSGEPGSYWYRMGQWFDGFPDGGSEVFTPALCNPSSDGYRYSPAKSALPKAKREKAFTDEALGLVYGNIGCREWAYQLKRPASLIGKAGFAPDTQRKCESGALPEEIAGGRSVCAGPAKFTAQDWQPYIDVTSHRTYRRFGRVAYVGDVLGWAGFDDPPRPVIGQDGPHWICFHECPDDEKPGVIPNFRLWLARRGWPEPQSVPFLADHKFMDPDTHLYGEY